LLSLLVTRSRRLDLAEDALGEAFARAATRWPTDGVPANPGGWLFTAAWRVMLAGLRSEAIHGRKAPLLAARADWVPPKTKDRLDDLDDERLALILLCCHPALGPGARSPLALRLVMGTPTEEIARLFLVPRATMAARITRAKKKIVAAGIPLSAPVDDELRTRLDDVCRTIYLAFTAGYAPGSGADLLRSDLAGEAVELAAILCRLTAPWSDGPARQVQALYGLLAVQHARREARAVNGELVTLADQDRSLWDHELVRLGSALLDGLEPGEGYAEELRLQGLIAAEHGSAATAADTDWSAITSHYRQLEVITGSPVVRLNRAVAVAEADGPAAGLVLLDGLDQSLASSHRLPAVRAELAARAGRHDLARSSYRAAIERCGNEVERRFLIDRLAALEGPVA
jgi:RNA polymerase sigma-70 factor (ECF subfamily)